MTNLAQLTGASLDFTADGQTYLISPLVDADFGELLIWVQSEIIAKADRMIKQLSDPVPIPDSDRQLLLKATYADVQKVTLNSPEFNNHLLSLEGGIRLAWMSLRHKHPDMTKERAAEIMHNPELGPQLMEKIDSLRRLHSTRPTSAKVPKKALRQAKKRPMPLTRKSTGN